MLVAAIVVIGVLLLAALVLAMSRRSDTQRATGMLSRETRKRDRSDEAIKPIAAESPALTGREVERAARQAEVEPAASTAAVPYTPPAPIDEEALGVTRRQFLNRSLVGAFGLSVAGFGAAVLGFLWPTLQAGGFGSVITAGKLSDILASIQSTKAPYYVPNARTYLQPYPTEAASKAKSSGAYPDPIIAGMELGLVGLYQKCVHLGCRVPWCQSSQWFECPCHGSQYNRVGEKKGGPAPRGLDRFALSVGGGVVSINTQTVYLGPPIGTNTTGQEAEGPHCH
jgi:cytochrome b6-f complex iron-sulfur subunit